MTEPSQAPSTNPGEQDDEIDLLEILTVLAENLRLLILAPLAAGAIALGITYLITPTFTAKMQFLPPQQSQSAAAGLLASLGPLGGLAGAASGLKNPADQYVAFLKSASVQNALVTRFDLAQRYKETNREYARRALAEHLRIAAGKEGIISVEADDHDPVFAADLANAHTEELQKLLSRLAVTEAQQRRVFFEKHMAETRDKLTAAEQALKSTGVSSSTLKATPASAVEGVARMRAALSAQEVKLGSMRVYLTDSSPELRQAVNDLVTLKRELEKMASAEPGEGAGDYIARYREFKYQETLFELFAKQYELAKVDESREGAVIQVVDSAQVPETKTKPKRATIAVISALVAALTGIAIVLVSPALKKRAHDPRYRRLVQTLRGAASRQVSRSSP